MNSNNKKNPEIWTELIILNSLRSDYDDDEYIPQMY